MLWQPYVNKYSGKYWFLLVFCHNSKFQNCPLYLLRCDIHVCIVLCVGRCMWSLCDCLPHTHSVITMDAGRRRQNFSSSSVTSDVCKTADDENGNRPVTKQPLSKKTSVLPPAVKQNLITAFADMKKSVVNVKKSPWLLTRSSVYLHFVVLTDDCLMCTVEAGCTCSVRRVAITTSVILSVNWCHIRLIDLVLAKRKTKVSWLTMFQYTDATL